MNLVEQLIEAVSKKRKRIVIIGDAITDHWIHGRIETCQDHCPKFIEESYYTTPGGAANAANCLSHWEVNTSLFTYADSHKPHKHRYVNQEGKIVFRYDNEISSQRMKREEYKWCDLQALEMIECAAGVLLSDYDKGYLTPEFMREVIDVCKKRNIPCVVDAKREPKLYKGAIIKCNASWYIRYGNGDVTTHGEHAPFVDNTEMKLDLPQVKCINHVGAGDCFAAHLTLALAYGFSLRDAAAISHSAGRVYVQYKHNRPPQPQEIAADMRLTLPS